MNNVPKTVVLKLAGEAGVDPRTAERWLLGKPTRRLASERLEEAAKRLEERKAKEAGQ